jgi:hypothetical protein
LNDPSVFGYKVNVKFWFGEDKSPKINRKYRTYGIPGCLMAYETLY